MTIETILTQRLGLDHPVIQAPLAGGGDTPALVAAVAEAGALGFIGAAYSTPAQIAAAAHAVRERTGRPFGINLFAPLSPPTPPRNFGPALQRLAPYYVELGLPPPTVPSASSLPFDEQFAACLASGASVFSFAFGVLPSAAVAAIKERGLFLMGSATTVEEALALERAGVDAVVLQGSEAGGHRGTFIGNSGTDDSGIGVFSAGLVGTMALVPQAADAVRVPVVASGGIMDGRGVAAALALGAAAVQMGTAFLTCDEAGIPDVYKRAILDAREHETRITRAFSGRPARGIANRFMIEFDGAGTDAILPFPLQNALTRPIRNEAAKAGRAEFLSLWAGQGVRLARRQPAAELVARLASETASAIRRLSG